jgi:trimeric autotransporter adhesin
MKKIFSSIIIICIAQAQMTAQNVGINATGATPHPSAMLDVSATNKGFLMPRMTTAQRTAIATPAEGLKVYDTDTKTFWYYNATAWKEITTGANGWNLTGNAGTTAANFIGTTDDKPLQFKLKNVPSGIIDFTSGNTALGYQSLFSATSGTYNTAHGYQALASNTTGFYNTANGYQTLFNNTTGSENTANGAVALYYNSTGSRNTANGIYALYANTTGSNNVATGYQALLNNTIGTFNTANGFWALQSNTTGYNNVAIGYQALLSNTIGIENTATGSNALYSNIYGSDNTANGKSALYSNTTGSANTANGESALYSNTSGSANTANGLNALYSNTAGIYNTAYGIGALLSNTTGSYNIAIGFSALSNNLTGSNNVGIGGELDLTYSNFNTAIGVGSHISGSNDVVIGSNSFTNVNNLALLGSATTTQCGGYANWSNFSDGRFKTGVKEDVKGLDFIMRLRPVTYHMDVRAIYNLWGMSPYSKESKNVSFKNAAVKAEGKQRIDEAITSKEAIRMSGFIAQEVEKAATEAGYDFDGVIKPAHDKDHYRLAYGEFVVPLVKAVQEQQTIINNQNKKIDTQQKQIEQLEKRMAALEAKK